MAKAESIEALLNPSLRVSRPVAACARCRSAKIKCDGKLPACSACERAGKAKECSSANDDFARGKERSYVSALETTVQRLQRRLKDTRQHREAGQHLHLSAAASFINGRPVVAPRPVSGHRRKEALDVDELVSDFGFLTVNATARDFHGFASTMSFAKLLMAVAVRKPLPSSSDFSLPPRHVITPLIEHYFTQIYVLLPFFSETSFMSSLSRIYQETGPATSLAPLDHWYVRLILAISSAAKCKLKGDQHYQDSRQHISVAMNLIEYVIHPGSTADIQALLLLVQYSLVDPEHFDSWYLIGMTSRLLVDLGLHCEPAPETKLSKQALDLRRRIFYCTYALDRQISMACNRAFSFTDDSAPNVLLPTLATDLEKRSPTQLFLRSVRPSLFLFDIRRVQSTFYQATRSSSHEEWSASYTGEYITSVLGDIHAWHASLPDVFEQSHLHYFHLEYIYSQLLAIAPCQTVPIGNVTDAHKALIFQLAIQFSDRMQLVVQNNGTSSFLSYADLCRVHWIAKQFQTILFSNFDQLLRHQQALVAGVPVPGVTAADNCSRAIDFVNRTLDVLDFGRTRWGLPDMRDRFEQESAVLLARLQNKQQEYTSHTSQQASSNPFPSTTQVASTFNTVDDTNSGLSQDTYVPQLPGSEQIAMDGTPAMHRSNLLRNPWATENPNSYQLPPGSLPRRSYEFIGNRGNG